MTGMIERQAAIDALARTAREKFNLSDEYSHYLAGLMDGELAIKNLPSAEPKKGKWKVTPCYIKCSECGECFMLIPQNFCPACGAKMETDHE